MLHTQIVSLKLYFELTILCFLCSSSAYFVTSFTRSVTFCTIWQCNCESLSADVFKICHNGANVPCTQQLPACFANLLNSFELFSSILDLRIRQNSEFNNQNIYYVIVILDDNPNLNLTFSVTPYQTYSILSTLLGTYNPIVTIYLIFKNYIYKVLFYFEY